MVFLREFHRHIVTRIAFRQLFDDLLVRLGPEADQPGVFFLDRSAGIQDFSLLRENRFGIVHFQVGQGVVMVIFEPDRQVEIPGGLHETDFALERPVGFFVDDHVKIFRGDTGRDQHEHLVIQHMLVGAGC